MTDFKNKWKIFSFALAGIMAFGLILPVANADVKKTIDGAYALIAGLQTQINSNNAVDSAQQTQIDTLETDVNVLKGAVQVDGSTGEVTINSADNIVLKPAPSKGVKTMEEATFEESVAMMDDATVTGDATVSGESALEGDIAAMSDAEINGFLTMTPQDNTIVNALLTPTGSSVDVDVPTGNTDLALIAPAAPGTELTLRFHLGADTVLRIFDCAPGSFGSGNCVVGPFDGRGIDLNVPLTPGQALTFIEEDTTLRVVFTSDGVWEEAGRTQLSGYQNIIGPDQTPPTDTSVPPNTTQEFTVSCNDDDIAIGGNIEALGAAPFTIGNSQTMGKDYTVEVTTGGGSNEFRVTATCLHLA
jgi:hypothetical protein